MSNKQKASKMKINMLLIFQNRNLSYYVLYKDKELPYKKPFITHDRKEDVIISSINNDHAKNKENELKNKESYI